MKTNEITIGSRKKYKDSNGVVCDVEVIDIDRITSKDTPMAQIEFSDGGTMWIPERKLFSEPVSEDVISVGTDTEESETNVIDVFIEQVASDDYPTYRRAVRVENIFNDSDDEGKKAINDFCLIVCGYTYETLQEMADRKNAENESV